MTFGQQTGMKFRLGFTRGEQDAFRDRRRQIRRQSAPSNFTGDKLRGWWAGYTPRSEQWKDAA